MKLDGKVALVTGGTDGIGRALARAMKVEGASVMICGRDPGRLGGARTEGFATIAADLATETGRDAIVNMVRERPIDILVNNAGMGADFDIAKPIDLAAVDRCIALNLTAPIHLVATLIDGLRTRPEAMIVNVTSGLAIAPSKKAPVYCATKAGLRSFTMALRAQLTGTTVHVMEVLPPVVDTQMTADNPHRKLSPEACAAQIVAAMKANRVEANVGMTRLLSTAHNLSPAIARRVMLNY